MPHAVPLAHRTSAELVSLLARCLELLESRRGRLLTKQQEVSTREVSLDISGSLSEGLQQYHWTGPLWLLLRRDGHLGGCPRTEHGNHLKGTLVHTIAYNYIGYRDEKDTILPLLPTRTLRFALLESRLRGAGLRFRTLGFGESVVIGRLLGAVFFLNLGSPATTHLNFCIHRSILVRLSVQSEI